MTGNSDIARIFEEVTVANAADACIRLGVPFLKVPPAIRPLFAEARCAGRAMPVTHAGSVDVFLEAMDRTEPGDVLVIDNGNRDDEGCIGDLTVLEAVQAQLGGVVLWGSHRDTTELLQIRLPLFSTGTHPVGPLGARPRPATLFEACSIGSVSVTRQHFVLADSDGVLFIHEGDIAAVLDSAKVIAVTERAQAERIRSGKTLREQLQWSRYMVARAADPALTFRQHLIAVGGAVEV